MAQAKPFFSGSVPENYDRYLGPMVIEPYAADLARRIPAAGLKDVLELACGTGIVTKKIRDRLSPETRLVATDVSEPMLNLARSKPGINGIVEWKVADATALPFKDESFDMVLCQFGIMFFPDKEKAVREIFRVLRPGGRLLFSTWDKIEHNELSGFAHEMIGAMFEHNPPAFYEIPFGYHDHYAIRTLLRSAGFVDVALTNVEMKIKGTPADAAKGYVHGNPIADEIKNNLGKDPAETARDLEQAFEKEFGQKMTGHARAILVGARKPGVLSESTRMAEANTAGGKTARPATGPRKSTKKPPAKSRAAKKPAAR